MPIRPPDSSVYDLSFTGDCLRCVLSSLSAERKTSQVPGLWSWEAMLEVFQIDIGWDQGSLVNGKLPHSWSRQKLPSMKTHPKIKHDAPSAETILFILTQVFLSYGQCIQSLPMVMPNSEW